MAKGFASTTDMAEKKITFSEIGTDLYAFTAEGDPNSAVIVGDDGCIVFDAQATPAMANKVIERVRTVTDKPIKYVVLSHYHAVRVLGASAYKAQAVIASAETYRLIEERGQQDWDSEYGRFPRLFQDAQSIPGLTWPTLTFEGDMSIYLGKREVRLMQLGAGHTSGDIVAWVPDARSDVFRRPDRISFGLLLRRRAFARMAGDAERNSRLQSQGDRAGARRCPQGHWRRARRHRHDARFRHLALWRRRNRGRQGPQSQGDDGGDPRGDGSEVFELRDLRTLPAVQRLARVRRGLGDRRSRDLDRRTRPGNVGQPCKEDDHEHQYFA